MSELIAAAKAVIYDWDKYQNVHHESVNMLSAAVERAEKPSADFMGWWKTYPLNTYGMAPAFHGWEAGQQAERERIRARVMELGKDWVLDTEVQQYADLLLESGDE